MNNGDDFEDDLAAYNERQREEGIDDENLDQQAYSAIPEFNPVLNAEDTDQNLEDIQSQHPQPKAMSDKEEEEEEDEEGFYKDEEEEEQETPVSVQELKP